MGNFRIVSLNTWGGTAGSGILANLSKFHHDGAHVICLQEVHDAPYDVPQYLKPSNGGHRIAPLNAWLRREIETILGDHYDSYYAPQLYGCYHDCEVSPYSSLRYGNLLLIRKELPHTYRSGFIVGEGPRLYDRLTGLPASKTAQVVDIFLDGKVLTVGHGHGAWANGHKGNLPWRREQAARMLELLSSPHQDKTDPHVVLVGDWNVTSDTETIEIFRTSSIFGPLGAEHLNVKFGIVDTRTKHYPQTKPTREADHAFASPILNARMSMDKWVASDHAATIICVLYFV